MASEFIPPEIVPIVWFACISVTVYVFFRVFSSTLREKFKQTNLSRRQAEKGGNTDGQIDDLISNAPRILHEIDKQIAEQEEAIRYYREGIARDSAKLKQLRSAEGLETFARERYFMKRQDEEVFIIEFEDSLKQKENE